VKRVTPYLRMRVLGAIEFAPGQSIVERIKHVSGIVFTDENDGRFQFTWRTIQTWYSRYKKDGVTSMHPRARSDKGVPRKVQPELLAEAIDQVRPESTASLATSPRSTARASSEVFCSLSASHARRSADS
jgi:hypothetical protein